MRAALALLTLLLAVALARSARADDLATIRARGTLVWGADQVGGGPYVYPRDDDPTQVTGFEVELAAMLAAELGVRAEPSFGDWDKLPDLLRAQKIDVILNGYELSPERAAVMAPTKPYYVYGLQLLSKREAPLDWSDVTSAREPKRRVGVLTGSGADTLMTEHEKVMEVVRYDGNTDAMREVETGKLDATVQDTPIVAFYAPRFPALAPAKEVRGAGTYVLYARSGEQTLVDALDQALAKLHERGDLETLYRKYGMWNDQQREARRAARGEGRHPVRPQRRPHPGRGAKARPRGRPRLWARVAAGRGHDRAAELRVVSARHRPGPARRAGARVRPQMAREGADGLRGAHPRHAADAPALLHLLPVAGDRAAPFRHGDGDRRARGELLGLRG
ncbi:MAG: amino acid ABC transporter substrate-binding protein [Polyangiaceae bacterium]|nr:amino acid ABC transporter substrate-binding protein [Polyangiaceae bacterium]